ncbi:DUF6120 family protein [Amedibacillus sp. YH-ame6]
MEEYILLYMREVKSLIAMHSKQEKEFLKKLKSEIIQTCENENATTYKNIVELFGTPKETAISYIETIEMERITRHVNSKKLATCFLLSLVLVIVGIYTYDSYRLNKLLDAVQEEKDAKKGIWAPSDNEEITYE